MRWSWESGRWSSFVSRSFRPVETTILGKRRKSKGFTTRAPEEHRGTQRDAQHYPSHSPVHLCVPLWFSLSMVAIQNSPTGVTFKVNVHQLTSRRIRERRTTSDQRLTTNDAL
jgi:hypothetical protein